MAKAGIPTAEDGCTFWSDGHLCERGVRHCDQCLCKCGHRWDRAPELVAPERATVVTVQPGDKFVMEVPHRLTDEEIDDLRTRVKDSLGDDITLVALEQGRFAGVLRRKHLAENPCGLVWLTAEGCPKRQDEPHHVCGRPSCHDREHECVHCGHLDDSDMVDVSTPEDVLAGRRVHIPGKPVVTKSPQQWADEQNVRIVDPDGWRTDGKPFDEPITKGEFDQRLASSTIDRLCGHQWSALYPNPWCTANGWRRSFHKCATPAAAPDKRHTCACGATE